MIIDRLSIGGSDTETFIFYMMLALRPALWLFMAAGRRPAARLGAQCIVLVDSVIIMIDTDGDIQDSFNTLQMSH